MSAAARRPISWRRTSGVRRDRSGRSRPDRAFTVVELMVVIGIIVLILALGVPAFTSMTKQQRVSKTRQLLNGMLTRTHVTAVSDKNYAAVRIMPAEWHLSDDKDSRSIAGRQLMTTYTWRHTYAAIPDKPGVVQYDERFEQIEDGPTHLLPPDTWLAPSEVFDPNTPVNDGQTHNRVGISNLILRGQIGKFELHAGWWREDFLEADDFLIVFDPETGVQRSNDGINRKEWWMRAYDPINDMETDGNYSGGTRRERFVRYNFAGAVIYPREPFVGLGVSAAPVDRRRVLAETGQTFYVNRNGGGLIAGEGQ